MNNVLKLTSTNLDEDFKNKLKSFVTCRDSRIILKKAIFAFVNNQNFQPITDEAFERFHVKLPKIILDEKELEIVKKNDGKFLRVCVKHTK